MYACIDWFIKHLCIVCLVKSIKANKRNKKTNNNGITNVNFRKPYLFPVCILL